MSSEEYGRYPIAKARHPYTCGLTGRTRTAAEVILREDHLARGIGQILRFDPHLGSEWDRVVAVFSVNTVSNLRRDELNPLTNQNRLTTSHLRILFID